MRNPAMRPVKVLLVDANPAFRSAAGYYLGTAGKLDVLACIGNGEEAVEKVLTLHPDLVLMELVPPLQYSRELFARLKAVDPSLRVVALTSHDNLDDSWASTVSA